MNESDAQTHFNDKTKKYVKGILQALTPSGYVADAANPFYGLTGKDNLDIGAALYTSFQNRITELKIQDEEPFSRYISSE